MFVCGIYRGDIDFDPGPGIEMHSSDNMESYLTKFLPDGSW